MGCATIAPPQPPSLALPKPPSDLSARRKGDHVILSWTVPTLTTDRQAVRSLGLTRICRSLIPELRLCEIVGEVNPLQNAGASGRVSGQKVTQSYSDALPKQLEIDHPLDFATYAVEVLNVGGHGAGLSNQARVPLVSTLPPPKDLSARVSAQGVVLNWTGYVLSLTFPERLQYVYRVYRRTEGSEQQIFVGEIRAGGMRDLTLTDTTIDWEQTYYYHVTAVTMEQSYHLYSTPVTVVAQPEKPTLQVEGDDTSEVKVFTHDIFPPAVPSGLQAVFSGPGQQPFIDLVWAPVTDVDLAGYNVYRREDGASAIKLNAEPVATPAYRDTNVTPDKHYLYSVSAVDARGNESAKSEEVAESVP
jgi:hypothetical protein